MLLTCGSRGLSCAEGGHTIDIFGRLNRVFLDSSYRSRFCCFVATGGDCEVYLGNMFRRHISVNPAW